MYVLPPEKLSNMFRKKTRVSQGFGNFTEELSPINLSLVTPTTLRCLDLGLRCASVCLLKTCKRLD